MFWRFGGYANISTIDTILDKPDFTLEELLEDSDLIQELKQHNTKLIEYLREKEVLEKLLEYVVTPKLEPVATPENDEDEDRTRGRGLSFSRPRASSRATDSGNDEDDGEKKRNKYAYVAAEILASDNWSICEALLEAQSRELLRSFWQFLKRPVPLDPLQASYFTKVNESLFDKKTDEMLDLLKSLDDAVSDMLRHVDSPMIMDLLLKIISLERTESGQGIIEWLYTQDVIPALLSFLGPEHSWATQTSAGDFLKAIITVSANASQNEQTCIGPNELTRQLVSRPCVQQLITYMLGGGNALTVGVGIVIEVIRKNNSDYDPDVGVEAPSVPSSRDPIYLGNLLRMFADNVPNFMNLIMKTPAHKELIDSTFGDKIEPLGFDRFKTCELMAELLHCSNMGLLNEVGSEELISKRDTERQQLRSEGKLAMIRGEDGPPNAEDLTMRMRHSSPAEEGRKLEVMNVSDEDGFEEVTHTGDMGEDTSNEFVKTEDETPQDLPTSSFLERDDDDFVDEPLSSPRLNVRDDAFENEQQFEEPDLFIAPLSPSKEKATTLDKQATSDPQNLDVANPIAPADKIGEMDLDDKPRPLENTEASPDRMEVDGHLEESETPAAYAPALSSVSETDNTALLGDHPACPTPGGLSPHPEDTPAPLFSSRFTDHEAAESVSPAAEGDRVTQPAKTPAALDPAPSATDVGEASTIVAHASDNTQTNSEETQLAPVVGDYLKVQFVEHGVVPTILSFFFKFPWNNFLHNVVYDIVQQVFNGPMDRGYNPTLAISLFESADITTQIIHGQLASEESQANTKTRMGYMGHLTLIAEEVVKFTERHPPELLSETVLDRVMAQDWINYVEGALAETRERDNAILGGVRPEVALSNRAAANGLSGVGLSGLGSALNLGGGQGASSALAEAGLNGGFDLNEGNGGNGIGPFAISAGTMMSGFGSSSDEDDDGSGEDNDEDVANEFRAYTDPLNNNNASSSMNPPSIPPPPPPPPPLNIPPSRARLQLAARLAMNKRNAAPIENGEDESGEARGGLMEAAPVVERLRNPFADDEDNEDEDEGSGSDDDREGDATAATAGIGGSGGLGGWGRGSWWRGVVRRNRSSSGGAEGGAGRREGAFGEGANFSDEDIDEEDEDEEFGDFAMPEVASAPPRQSPVPDSTSDEKSNDESEEESDKEREKVLLKPLPVHPPSGTGKSSFGSLWPFGSHGIGAATKGKKDEGASSTEPTAGAGEEGDPTVAEPNEGSAAHGEKSEGSTSSEQEIATGASGPGNMVVDEDGEKVSMVTQATSRRSIEELDDDEDEGHQTII